MATNPYVNKVIYGNNTVMDISDTTAEEEDVVSGKTFYKADGAKGVGRAVIPSTDDCYKTTDDEAYAIGDNDYFPYFSDSLSEKVKISWYNFKSRIKAYFDTIYAQFAGTEAELRDTVGWTGKNLYPLTLDSLKELNTSGTWSGNVYTLNSVTFTVSTNSDGYVTAVTTSGTASAQTSFYFISSTVGGISDYLPSGNYIMNGCANGGSLTGSFRMDFDIGTTMNVATDSSDKSFSIPSDSSLLVFWTIGISSGQNMASKTFYPMIRKATIGSNTFEPYHSSVKQTLRDAEVIKGKNLLENKATSQTINGVIFVVNADGTVTVNGTATANTFLTFPFVLPIGEFILTGCPTNGGYGNYLAKITDRQGSGITGIADDTGSGSTFTNSSALDVQYSIRIANGYTANNVVFKPMLRYATEADPTFEPYYIPLKDGKVSYSVMNKVGAKNILDVSNAVNADNVVSSVATNGYITFKDVTARWSSTYIGKFTVKAGDVIVISSTASLTYGRIGLSNTASHAPGSGYDPDLTMISGSGLVRVLKRDNKVSVYRANSNQTVYAWYCSDDDYSEYHASFTVGLMIRFSEYTDDTYAPYAMTNKELTDKVSDMPTLIPATADDTDVDAIAAMSYSDASQNKGVNAFTIKKYSNVDSITLWTTVAAGNDTIGVWNDGWKEESPRVRTGWLWHECLYHVLSDNDVECVVVFDVITEETVSAYAYRVDDDYPRTINGNTVNGGCVAIKLNSAIQNENGVKVGIKLIRQRTQSIEVTPLT